MSIEIPLNDRLTVEQAIAAANAAKRGAQQALAGIPAAIDAEVGPAAAPYITQASNAKDAALVAQAAAEVARDNAIAAERRMRTQSLGAFADDAAAVAWAAAQTPPITIVTGASYLNTTSDIFRYAVVSAGPTITWHDVTEDEAAQAALATASATAAQNALSDFLTRYVGPFNSTPTYVGDTAPWSVGALYWNRLQGKFFVWSGSAWGASDATTVAAAQTASDAAVAAAGSAATASGAADTATTKASDATAAKTAAESARDAAAGSATAAGNSNAAAQSALTQTISYAALAQAGAASVSAQTGLSILAAAQRAIALMTDGAATFIYDTRRDSDGGAWVDKCISQSYVTETLNTATRGATPKPPKMMLIVGRNSTSGNPAVTIYDMSDPTTPMWMVFIGNGYNPVPHGTSWPINSIAALNGRIFVGQGNSEGLAEIDLIADTMTQRSTACNLWLGGVVNRNANSATGYVATSSISPLNNGTVNSIAATIAPNTPLNPLRCNLPNPTVAVATTSGVSVIRADGVVCSSSATFSAASVSFDQQGNLWTAQAGANLHVTRPASYLAASFSINALVYWSEVAIGVGTLKAVNASGPVAVIAGASGLARIKLDQTNPANSLINVKTTTYDTGWMVLGKTVLAMAESSQALATLTAAQVVTNSTFATDLSGWTSGDAGTGYASAWNTGGGMILPRDGTAANYGRRYQQVTLPALAGGNISITCTGGEVNCYIGTVALTNDVAQIATSGGAAKKSFTVPASGVVYITLLATANGTSPVVTSITCDVGAKDVSGSGNGPKAVGAPTRAVVATGADTAGVGTSSTAYFAAPRTAAMDWGANDLCIVGWTKDAGNAGSFVAYQDGVGSLYGTNPGFVLCNWNGAPSFQVWDGAGHQAQLLPSAGQYNWTASGVHMVVAQKRGSVLEIFVDNVKMGYVSASSIVTVTNTAAQLLIGALFYNAAITAGANNLVTTRVFNTSLTLDQMAFMYADEKAKMNAYAQSLLTGANVQGVAWDPDTEQLAAPNSTGGCDVFKGSVRAANDNSATGSTNKLAAVSDNLGGGGWSLNGVYVSGASGVVESASLSRHFLTAPTVTGSQTITATVAKGARGYAAIGRTNGGGYWDVGLFNLSTGAFVAGYNYGGVQAGTFSVVADGAGWRISAAYSDGNPLSLWPVVIIHNAATDPVNSANLYVGDAVTIGAYVSKFMVNAGVTPATYAPSLSGSANAKAVAMAQGKVAVITAAGVDVWIPAAPGQRETAEGVGASKRAFYDPTFSISTFRTSDATPTVGVSSICPEGKAYRVRDTVSFVQTGGAATEKAAYVVEALVTRDLGGNVVVVSTTTTISETTASLDYVIAANTTAQTYEGKATGKAATPGMWTVEREVYDAGLMMAA